MLRRQGSSIRGGLRLQVLPWSFSNLVSFTAHYLRPETSPPEPQAPEGPQAGAEGPPSPEASRSPAHGAYLQSLEPSSRRWVLGGAKPPEETTLGPGAPGSGEPAGEIWYNPIPEEDPRLPAPELSGPQPGSAEADSPASPGEHKPPTLGPAR